MRRVIPIHRILRHIQADHDIVPERPCYRNGEFPVVRRHAVIHDKLCIRLIQRQQHLLQHIRKNQNGAMLAVYVAVGNQLQRNHVILQTFALLQSEQPRRIGECHIKVARAVVARQRYGFRVHFVILLRKQFVIGSIASVIFIQDLFRQFDRRHNGLVEITGTKYPNRRFGNLVDRVKRFGDLQSVVDDVNRGIGKVGVTFIFTGYGQHPQSREYEGNMFELFHDKMLVS